MSMSQVDIICGAWIKFRLLLSKIYQLRYNLYKRATIKTKYVLETCAEKMAVPKIG
jgi:hypothetical protein